MTEPDFDLSSALLHDRWEELAHDSVLVFREEERLDGRATRLVDVVEPDHFQSGAIDEERDARQVAHADEVRTALDERDEHLSVRFSLPLARHVTRDFRGAHDLRRRRL